MPFARAQAARLRRALRTYPGQFWLVFATTFFFLASSSLVFPFVAVYLTGQLGISRTEAGVVLGLANLAGLPLQVLGGSWADRRGRRGPLLFSLAASTLLMGMLAAVRGAWQAELVVVLNGALGWPLFLTASNAMVADLVEQERTAEAYSIVRVALNGGVVAGPALAGIVLGAGVSFSWLFGVAACGCGVLLVVAVARLAETRPRVVAAAAAGAGLFDSAETIAVADAAAEPVPPDPAAPAAGSGGTGGGYGVVFRDRAFLLLCVVSLLPLFCYGHISSTYPVYLTQFLHVPVGRWGLLLSLNAVLIVAFQFPLVRSLQRFDSVVLVAVASAMIGIGIGGSAFAADDWSLWLLMIVFSVGEMVFVPLSTSLVSGMATVAERGRYMGLWSLFWVGGQALSPLLSGWGMDALGGRAAMTVVLAVGLTGAALFLLVRRRLEAGPLRYDGRHGGARG